ncbi:MAG: response regulator [Candidatus Gastranaerophilales bacterium]
MKKVLIVDDSPNWLKYHTQMINIIYYNNVKIDLANSAIEGVGCIERELDTPYDLILTDMQMEMNFLPLFAGEWFIKEVKTFKEYNNSQIIAISAATNLSEIASKYSVDFLPKYNCENIDNYKKVIKNN